MRRLISCLLLALAACSPATPPPAPTTATTVASTSAATPAPWFICDAIDAPSLFLFTRDGDVAHVSEFERPSGASEGAVDLQIGEGEGAAGSIYTPLTRDGADAGFVRELNPGALEHQGIAYTPLISSIKLGEREATCRWLPRTRVQGFTGRRSFVISEDADGDLIYTTFDFAAAAGAQPIDLGDNGRSTAFSVEVRGGSENVRPDGADFRFAGRDGYAYHVSLVNAGAGQLQVERNGVVIQTEPLTAFIVGQASAN